MPNKEVSNITLEIGDMIETYDLTDSNNPVIELKDTVTENANAGTEQHVFKETTADGHENQISDFLIAQKQISALRANSTGDGLVMESYDQKATHQQTDLRLAQVTTNKNNIATAQSDIRGLQTSVSQAEEDITNAQTSIDNVDADLQSTKTQLTALYYKLPYTGTINAQGYANNNKQMEITIPIVTDKPPTAITLNGGMRCNGRYVNLVDSELIKSSIKYIPGQFQVFVQKIDGSDLSSDIAIHACAGQISITLS